MGAAAALAKNGRLARLRRAVIMSALAWTVVVSGSLAWDIYNTWGNTRDLATREARTHLNKDGAIRMWSARHGGIYVQADPRTPPNPNLAHVPERDVVTPSGRLLTLMNSSYMLRQMMTEYGDRYGIRGRLTSLHPLNPDNAADPWEAEALRRFEAGEREISEVSNIAGEPHLRLMNALMVEQSCLKCHGSQGYREGDVRGGVGVVVPLKPYYALAETGVTIQVASHGAIWLIGLGGILAVGRRFRVHALAEVAEQARTEHLHHKLDLVLSSVSDGILGVDKDGAVTFANPAAASMLGYTVAELCDRPVQETVRHTHADGQPCGASDCPTVLALRDGCARQRVGELLLRKDGSVLPVEMVGTPILDGDRAVGVVVVFRDVSERLEAERRTGELVERLAQSNQDLQQFAYTVSHDLQEPLRMISSYVQLLGRRLQPMMDQDCREFIAFAVDGAARMSRMIADLVEFSRVESRGGPLEEVASSQVVADALTNLGMAITEAQAVVQVVEPLPVVMGDASQLARLFQNLIGNAVKFRSPDRPPRLRIDAMAVDGMAEFRVADNGIGIPEDGAERIFQIFQRLHGRDRYDGTGIGLAIVRRIAERHGGRVWVDSQVGEGSVFHVTLPLAKPAE
jgi:PAS domain S-box-containing protein